jgi:transposase
MPNLLPDSLTITEARHLPIVKHFAQRLNLVETIDRMVGSQMQLSPGLMVLAMALDTLSGRTPLYRLQEFFEDKDTELLLGSPIDPASLADYNIGRGLDAIYQTGTQKIFSRISQNALERFEVDPQGVHFDTTSISVFGDYQCGEEPFQITYGHSKDKRPDLKQFVLSMLCVDRNIPILGACHDGNASDKTINNELLTQISQHMARHGLSPGAFVYVADAAFVTPGNLQQAVDDKLKFLTRLPATYNECSRAIDEAVAADAWQDLGQLAQEPASQKRPNARYRVFETRVTLHGHGFRALVVHSSAHDKRRHKRIDRQIDQDRQELEKHCKQACASDFFCLADAEAAADKLRQHSGLHTIQTQIIEKPIYGRGRPVAGKVRVPKALHYQIDWRIVANPDTLDPLRQEAGCFVLISSLDSPAEREQWRAGQLLSLYKEQNGIEKNFSFLKDPMIVNSIFLKKPERIEVLGLILLISLLIWRLIERSMRQFIERTDSELTGWKGRPTQKPTSFMLTTKFSSVLVAKVGNQRQLARPLKPIHLQYLKALNLPPSIYTVP